MKDKEKCGSSVGTLSRESIVHYVSYQSPEASSVKGPAVDKVS